MKVGHVSFLGPLNHTQMRALVSHHSQLSGFERGSQTLERAYSRSSQNVPCTLRLDPHAAFPDTRSVHSTFIAYPKTCPTTTRRLPFHANTGRGGFCGIFEHFPHFEFFLLPNRIPVRPSASNANRWAARCHSHVDHQISCTKQFHKRSYHVDLHSIPSSVTFSNRSG